MKRILFIILSILIPAMTFAAEPQIINGIRERCRQIDDNAAHRYYFRNEYEVDKTELENPDPTFVRANVYAHYEYVDTVVRHAEFHKLEIYEIFKRDRIATNFTEIYLDTGSILICCYKRFAIPGSNGFIHRRFYFQDNQVIRVEEGDRILDPESADHKVYSKNILNEIQFWRSYIHW